MAQIGGIVDIPSAIANIPNVTGPGAPGIAASGLGGTGANAPDPVANAAPAAIPAQAPSAAPASPQASFVATYAPVAQKIADKLNVSPDLIMGQLGLETGWGKHVIPGTNNLGNIKSTDGSGVAATDNQNGSKDKYMAFKDADAFADHYADMLQRKYPGVVGAGNDATKFTAGLKGYAEDPNYAAKVTQAAGTVSAITGGTQANPAQNPASQGIVPGDPGMLPPINTPQPDIAALTAEAQGPAFQAPDTVYTSDAASRAAAAPPAPPAPADTGFFSNLKRGAADAFVGLGKDTGALAALTGHVASTWTDGAVGQDLQDWGLKKLQSAQDDIAKTQQQSDSFTGAVGDGGSIKAWSAYTMGSALPTLAQYVITSAIGAAMGSSVGPEGTAVGGLAGILQKKLVEGKVLDAAYDLATQVAEEAATKGASREAAAMAGQQAASTMISKAANAAVGAKVGMFIPGFGQSVGSNYAAALDNQKATGEAPDLGKVFTAGAIGAALNTVGESKLIDAATGAGTNAIKNTLVKSAVKGSLSQAALQASIGAANTAVGNYGAGRDILSNPSAYLDSVAGGIAMGGVIGGVGGAVHRGEAPAPADPNAPIPTTSDPNATITPGAAQARAATGEPDPLDPFSPTGPLSRAATSGGLDVKNGAAVPDAGTPEAAARSGPLNPLGGNVTHEATEQKANAAAAQAAAEQAAATPSEPAQRIPQPNAATYSEIQQAALERINELNQQAAKIHKQNAADAKLAGKVLPPVTDPIGILPDNLANEHQALTQNLNNPQALSEMLGMPLPKTPPTGATVMWVNPAGIDTPVKFNRLMPKRSPDGSLYVSIEHLGENHFVPLDDIAPVPRAKGPEALPAPDAQDPNGGNVVQPDGTVRPANYQESANARAAAAPPDDSLGNGPVAAPAAPVDTSNVRTQINNPAAEPLEAGVDAGGNALDPNAPVQPRLPSPETPTSGFTVDSQGNARARTNSDEAAARASQQQAQDLGTAPTRVPADRPAFEADHMLRNGKPVKDSGKNWVDKDGKIYPKSVTKAEPITDVEPTDAANKAAKPAPVAEKAAETAAADPLETAVEPKAQEAAAQKAEQPAETPAKPAPKKRAPAPKKGSLEALFPKAMSIEDVQKEEAERLANETPAQRKAREAIGKTYTADVDNGEIKNVRPVDDTPRAAQPVDAETAARVKQSGVTNPEAVAKTEGIGYQKAVDAVRQATGGDDKPTTDPQALDELNKTSEAKLGPAPGGKPRFEPFEEPPVNRVNPGARAQAEGRRLAVAMAKAFGQKLSFFKNAEGSDKPIDGVRLQSGRLMVEGDSDHAHTFVFGHELTHRISQSRPDLYARIEKAVLDSGDFEKWAKDNNITDLDDDGNKEEFVADVVGKRMNEPEFWSMLANKNPSKFKEIASAVIRFADAMINKFRKSAPIDSYLAMKDITKIRDTIAGVLNEYTDHVDGGGDGAAFRSKITNNDVQNPDLSSEGMMHEVAASRALEAMPAPRNSAVKYMEGEKPTLPFAGRKPTVYDVAKFFQKKNAPIDITTPKGREAVAKAATHEALYALTKDGNAVGWYDRKVKEALSIIGKKYPEILTDMKARESHTLLTAITSNGQNVRDNYRIADKLYQQYKETGRYPEDFTEGGKTNQAMINSTKLMNKLTDELGHEKLMDFMLSNHPVRDIQKIMGLPISGELRDTVVPGSVILGPKIGSFFGNLNGHFDSVTMDKWFMRTINRMRGGLLGVDPGKMGGYLDKIEQLLPNADMKGFDAAKVTKEMNAWRALPPEKQADPVQLEKQKNLFGFMKKTLADYARGDGNTSYTDRSPLNNTVKYALQEATMPREAPENGGDRAAIRDVMARTQRQMQKQGINLSNADLQALLWYHEKDLYQRFGVGNELAKGFDYADAAREIAGGSDQQAESAASTDGRSSGADGRLQSATDGSESEELSPTLDDAISAVDAAKFRVKDDDQSAAPADKGPVQFGSGLRGSDRVLEQPYGENLGYDLEANPAAVKVPGYGEVQFHGFEPAQRAAREYAADNGHDYQPAKRYVKVDPERAKRIADAFEAMPHTPDDPVVKRAYQKMIDETLAQYQAIKKTGLKITPIDFEKMGDPYAASPRLAILDVVKNNHLYYFPTDAGFGGTESADVDISGNPLLQLTNEHINGQQLRANDVFRIVHDYFGHIKNGVGFRADGEENAWRAHSAMYSDEARRAMTTETRGQNSWVNYGPYSEFNKTAKAGETQYAPQKIGLLPDWVHQEGARDPDFEPQKASLNGDAPAEGATSVSGIHYGKVGDLKELDANKYGTGLKGAEFDRLVRDQAGPELYKRSYFYLRDGDSLPEPEGGVGQHVYQTVLHNMYDPRSAPPEVSAEMGRGTDFEQSVLDHGFDGYIDRDSGMAVVLGADKVPVDYLGLREGASSKPDVTTQSRALMARELNDVRARMDELQNVAPSAKLKGNGSLEFAATDAPAVDRFLARPDQTGPMFRQKDMINSATDYVHDLLATKNKFNWWDRTVGTQYNKALKNAGFKKVFDRIQKQMKDRTSYAMQSEALAPDILPKTDTLRDLGGDLARIWENKSMSSLKKPDEDKLSELVYKGTLQKRKWTDQELDNLGATPFQKKLYGQYLDSINDSLETLSKSEMGKLMAHTGVPDSYVQAIMDKPFAEAADYARSQLKNTTHGVGRDAAMARIQYLQDNVQRLQDQGYVPLQRFGKYKVHVTGKLGETQLFSMFENERDANKFVREISDDPEFKDSKIDQGVMPQEAWKNAAQMSPEMLGAFGDKDTITKDEATQFWIKNQLANRSTLKRLIERKGTLGYNEDPTRGLASFITSNARKAADNLNREYTQGAIESIPEGDVQDDAAKLHAYIDSQAPEAHKLRGYMFASFLGGSVASAMNNMLQPMLMTFPYLSKYGAGAAGKEMIASSKTALKVMFGGKHGLTGSIGDALARAEKEGVVKPHEIFQLMASAQGAGGAAKGWSHAMKLWGNLFAMSESFNRYSTFIAAHRLAEANGDADPYASAEQAVTETQGLYNKGNRPNWARGAVGSTLFTFKQFTIGYLELLNRMAPKQKMMMLGMLALGSGVNGMPFASNIEDLVDALAGKMGFDWNSEYEKQQFLNKMIGKAGANFVNHGVSAFTPFDLSGRIGVGDVIPGTGLINPANKDKLLETAGRALGPVGGVAQQAANIYNGNFAGALPTAIQNVNKALDIAKTGNLRDASGRVIQKAGPGDALMQAIGLTPAARKFGSESRANVQNVIDIQKDRKQELLNALAQATVDQDQAGAQRAREQIQSWNQKNPDMKIQINPSQIFALAKSKRLTADQRLTKAAPKALRALTTQSLSSGESENRASIYKSDGDGDG